MQYGSEYHKNTKSVEIAFPSPGTKYMPADLRVSKIEYNINKVFVPSALRLVMSDGTRSPIMGSKEVALDKTYEFPHDRKVSKVETGWMYAIGDDVCWSYLALIDAKDEIMWRYGGGGPTCARYVFEAVIPADETFIGLKLIGDPSDEIEFELGWGVVTTSSV